MNHSLPRPTADTQSVVDLVALVTGGRVRVPFYQRDLEWKANDVIKLFDSIYRGFPIGSLLLHCRPLAAKTVILGPLEIHGGEEPAGFDVVDGQQRLVALSASLARPLPLPISPDTNDPYVVYFDAQNDMFRQPPANGQAPSTWVPLPALGDGSRLTEWVFNWEHRSDAALRKRVFDAGSRIREYKIPLYSLATPDNDTAVLQELFMRVNTAGRPLKWPQIHDALYKTPADGAKPSTVTELMRELETMSVGVPRKETILRCLIAFTGKDVTRSYRELEDRSPRFLQETVAEALPTLRRVIDFVRGDAEILHMRLLPTSAPLTVLTRFFRMHPDPRARSRQLLTWWMWRFFLGIPQPDERSFQRRGVARIDPDDEEGSVQKLLELVPCVNPEKLLVSEHFDGRAANSRIALLALASLGPRDLESERVLSVSTLINGLTEGDGFRRIVKCADPLAGSPANRCLLPGVGLTVREFLDYSASDTFKKLVNRTSVLESHGIPPKAHQLLVEGDTAGFLRARQERIESALQALAKRLGGWDRPTRPSIDYLSRPGDE